MDEGDAARSPFRIRADALQQREAAVQALERDLEDRTDVVGRRRRVLGELRDYVRDREVTLRGRAARLGLPLKEVMAGLPELLDDRMTTSEELALAEEADAVLEAREVAIERREAFVARRRAWLEAVTDGSLGAEERLVAREQALADVFRRVVMASGGLPLAPPRPEVAPPVARRRHQRIEVRVPLAFGGPHDFIAAESLNVSAGGLFVATPDALYPGRSVTLRLQLPGEDELVVAGVVVWRNTGEPGEESGVGRGFGVRFVELDPVAERAIGRFLAYRAPLPPEWLL